MEPGSSSSVTQSVKQRARRRRAPWTFGLLLLLLLIGFIQQQEQQQQSKTVYDFNAYLSTVSTLPTQYFNSYYQIDNDPSTRSKTAMMMNNEGQPSRPISTRQAAIPLSELVQSTLQPPSTDLCHNNTRFFESRLLPESVTRRPSAVGTGEKTRTVRQIPRVIHITAKSRCLTPVFYNNLQTWKELPNHSVLLHDEEAMDQLLNRDWSRHFPHLQSIISHCLVSGAAKADIWRLLVLWEYGGIYTDMDNAPGPRMINGTLIGDEEQAFFVLDLTAKVLSQYYMAAMRHHPFIYVAIQHTLLRLLQVTKVGRQNVPKVTGPGAIKAATIEYFRPAASQRILNDEQATLDLGKPDPGHYHGLWNSTMTVVGGKSRVGDIPSGEYVIREAVRGRVDKINSYKNMGMKHFSHTRTKNKETCIHTLMESAFLQLQEEDKEVP